MSPKEILNSLIQYQVNLQSQVKKHGNVNSRIIAHLDYLCEDLGATLLERYKINPDRLKRASILKISYKELLKQIKVFLEQLKTWLYEHSIAECGGILSGIILLIGKEIGSLVS